MNFYHIRKVSNFPYDTATSADISLRHVEISLLSCDFYDHGKILLVQRKKIFFYRYYPYMCIFPIPKFHKTSYSLYGLATRILDLEEMVIKACSVALCLETILRFYSSLGEGFLIIKYTLDLLQCIKQWGQL